MKNFNCNPYYKDSSDSLGKPLNQTLLAFLALGLTVVAGCAICLGGTVITDVTATHIHVEVMGRLK